MAIVSLYRHSFKVGKRDGKRFSGQRVQAIAGSKLLDIFRCMANGTVESSDLKQNEGLTRKQYYFRTKQLLNVGLVKRDKGKFSLTNFGLVIYHAQLLMESGINNFWKLKAIDSIQETDQISEAERLKLIKTILNANNIERILIKQR